MRVRTVLSATLIGVLGLGLVVAVSQSADATTDQTNTNLATALHEEALALAEYQAWAVQADSVGNTTVAELLRTVAEQERDEHLVQLADALQLVEVTASNLRTGIVDERADATVFYPGFAAQATATGDGAAATLFAELATEEGLHRATLVRVLQVLMSGGRWPALLVVSPVPIVQGPAQVGGTTLANVLTAMRHEAYTSARYLLFSRAAAMQRQTMISWVFERLSRIELEEHFAQLANLAGLVGDTTANLTAAVVAEDAVGLMYDGWAAAATAAGDTNEAALFVDIRGDETGHLAAFTAALGG